ncbi:MAG: GNAT family N-acetyltransferase [Oceanospirillaceae bacterium]|nr:GNAT family N-acetyltransferase [Oceanospirillaceae bacterium]
MHTSLLANNQSPINQIAQWYFDQWLCHAENSSLEKSRAYVAQYSSPLGAPLMVLIRDGERLVGAAQLKIREMNIYPQYEHWLGGVYIDAAYRHSGYAKILVKEVITQARRATIKSLYLQTEDLSGGLYFTLGFTAIEQVRYNAKEVLVMKLELLVPEKS